MLLALLAVQLGILIDVTGSVDGQSLSARFIATPHSRHVGNPETDSISAQMEHSHTLHSGWTGEKFEPRGTSGQKMTTPLEGPQRRMTSQKESAEEKRHHREKKSKFESSEEALKAIRLRKQMLDHLIKRHSVGQQVSLPQLLPQQVYKPRNAEMVSPLDVVSNAQARREDPTSPDPKGVFGGTQEQNSASVNFHPSLSSILLHQLRNQVQLSSTTNPTIQPSASPTAPDEPLSTGPVSSIGILGRLPLSPQGLPAPAGDGSLSSFVSSWLEEVQHLPKRDKHASSSDFLHSAFSLPLTNHLTKTADYSGLADVLLALNRANEKPSVVVVDKLHVQGTNSEAGDEALVPQKAFVRNAVALLNATGGRIPPELFTEIVLRMSFPQQQDTRLTPELTSALSRFIEGLSTSVTTLIEDISTFVQANPVAAALMLILLLALLWHLWPWIKKKKGYGYGHGGYGSHGHEGGYHRRIYKDDADDFYKGSEDSTLDRLTYDVVPYLDELSEKYKYNKRYRKD